MRPARHDQRKRATGILRRIGHFRCTQTARVAAVQCDVIARHQAFEHAITRLVRPAQRLADAMDAHELPPLPYRVIGDAPLLAGRGGAGREEGRGSIGANLSL